MWKIDAIVVINQTTPDRNSIDEIADALRSAGADVHEVDPESGIIRISADPEKITEIKFVEGVDYIRSVMAYQSRDENEEPAV